MSMEILAAIVAAFAMVGVGVGMRAWHDCSEESRAWDRFYVAALAGGLNGDAAAAAADFAVERRRREGSGL